MSSLAVVVLIVAGGVGSAEAERPRVTGIRAACRNGQTFVTWKDAAEGEAGSAFRYALYRSDRPITRESLAKAELCYGGVLNNSAKRFGAAFRMTDRLDPSKPTCLIEAGGRPLPMWSGLAVRTVPADGKSHYAVVATDAKGRPVSRVEPGESATVEPLAEKVAPVQPIKQLDSWKRGRGTSGTVITGRAGLALMVSLHGSSSRGGGVGSSGDLYLYFATPEMGHRDGLPGIFAVYEARGRLTLFPRDCIQNPSGTGAIETCWFGYFCIPRGAKHAEPRAYPFTERRLDWMIRWVMQRYKADPLRVYSAGQSMGGMACTQFSLRRPEVFAAVYPRLQRVRQSWLPAVLPGVRSINRGRYKKPTPMADGRTDYFEHMDSVKWVREHHEDLPFYGWSCGRHDWVEPWKAYIEMVRALTANHHGFAMAWTDGGHSSGTARVIARVNKHYGPEKFARNRSYPAFGNSSIDDDMGTGELVEETVGGKKVRQLKDGDKTGGVNLGFAWSDLADEAGKWSARLSNELCEDEMTVDVTPRRCQKFRPQAGAKLAWTASTGQSGKLTADAWGLATVEKLKIKANQATTLTIGR